MQMLLILLLAKQQLKSCSGALHKLVLLGAAPVRTGPWPEVSGSRAGENQAGQLPQSKLLFYKDESPNHTANFKGSDFYLRARGRARGEAIVLGDVSDQKISC